MRISFTYRISIKDTSVAKLGSVCRRIYRIFSHAYYHHRTLYDKFEERTHLCRRFTVFALRYGLIPKDNLIVPVAGVTQDAGSMMQQPPSLVNIDANQPLKNGGNPPAASLESDA